MTRVQRASAGTMIIIRCFALVLHGNVIVLAHLVVRFYPAGPGHPLPYIQATVSITRCEAQRTYGDLYDSIRLVIETGHRTLSRHGVYRNL